MIPRLRLKNQQDTTYLSFFHQLKQSGFTGDIRSEYGDRIVSSTDNSIYQIIPQGVLFPRNQQDILHIITCLNKSPFKGIKVSPRGGGTGTNGQSLTNGIIIDLSRYMNNILEINVEERWARVQPGVVLDQLNGVIKTDGLFFPPTTSTSNRCTIGGMVNTDACGKGSFIYGRTSDHVIELTTILPNGEILRTQEKSIKEIEKIRDTDTLEGNIYNTVAGICETHQDLISNTLPKTRRCLTGYNLEQLWDRQNNTFNLNYLLSGAEGTLGIVTEIKVNLTPIPKHKTLVVVKYQSFDHALKDSSDLLKAHPFAIEATDSKVIGMAKEDEIYYRIKDMIADEGNQQTATINLVEFCSDTPGEVEKKAKKLIQSIEERKGKPGEPIGYYHADTPQKMAALWEFRKKGVGLLGNIKGRKRPLPFVEDTVVPPQNLADYIRDFIAVLDRHNLSYGMFGHIDVGCLHVRPALDMKDPDSEQVYQKISEEVVALVHQYGGVFWGEHGKGFRSTYLPKFFGDTLYKELRNIKTCFDPENRLNPGKIAIPFGINEDLVPLDSPTRGQRDREITPAFLTEFETSISCNGNGACLSFNPNDVICPSSKILKDKVNSPKGRIDLLREWLRQLSHTNHKENFFNPEGIFNWPVRLFNTLSLKFGKYDFSSEVFDALSGCLACKACASQCPIKVDVSEFRPKFFNAYHSRFIRPIRDYLVASLEDGILFQAKIPRLFNLMMNLRLIRFIIKYWMGLVDAPCLSEYTVLKGLKERGDQFQNIHSLHAIRNKADLGREVILIQDAYTSFYEARLVLNIYDLLKRLGFRVYVHKFFSNGKGVHIKGFMPKFKAIARQNVKTLTELSKFNIPIIGIDPAITLSYRDEYLKVLEIPEVDYNIQLIQEWLGQHKEKIKEKFHQSIKEWLKKHQAKFHLFGHCSEKTTALESQMQWQELFSAFGLPLQPIPVGCCGMGGVFGHEKKHYQESKEIYELSWAPQLKKSKSAGAKILAPGYSCRTQVNRFEGKKPKHPLEELLDILKQLD